MTIPTLTSQQIIERLSSALESPAAITFDADGTLWSGDVAEDVFGYAVEHELLRVEAREALIEAAAKFGLSGDGSASTLAGRIFDAYVAGTYPEREVCEVMTWCFAGFTMDELGDLAEAVLAEKRFDQRLHGELEPFFDWAGRQGVKTLMITASPRPIVLRAARRWGIEPSAIGASTPAVERGQIAPRMHSPVPYAEHKVTVGRELMGPARWLGAFGDSGFDADMLSAADVRVAVRPKPSLYERARSIFGLVQLGSER